MGFQQRFCQSLGGSVVAVALAIAPAWAEQIQNWSFNESKSELTFSLPDSVLPKFFLLAEPPRLVLDIPATQLGDVQPDQNYGGVVQTIRVAQHTPEQIRVVIELNPNTVLAPEQADIQFDDRDGQRYWRFRPLLADSTVATAPSSPPTAAAPSIGLESDISRSAANLAIPEASATAAVPIDPYENGPSSQMISVPPLKDEPILNGEQAAPNLPPMTVPVLENTADSVASSEVGSVPPAASDADLPELAEVSAAPQSIATVAPSENTSDNETVTIPVQPAAVADEITAAVPEAVAIPEVSADEMPVTSAASVAVAETALAAEPASVDNDETSSPAWQTIQQPAAERTIVQTEIPAPLTFGQPLPQVSN